ncbi:hypothetical protein [Weissella halotolerans]|uniref:Uncharacterized protein n=1 Tax=Weissella halotolerans DSM 20190 TaxID=1123500 RepID=A0A0R2G049_9LACO|nr:hypothetical protein [Weissella halotolerans]KRN33598.1 hypothetical protein IV68_GL000405 [Weissella halotolerans DSM 20190]
MKKYGEYIIPALMVLAVVMNIIGDYDWLYLIVFGLAFIWANRRYQQTYRSLYRYTAIGSVVVIVMQVVLMLLGWH